MIETKRLKIYAASREEMEAFIAAQSVDVLKEAYTEMLNGALLHPDRWEWYAIWMIELVDGTHIGELCFKGLSKDGSAEIGYGISEDYQGCGYATEAVSALVDWALKQSGVSCVTAETEETNIASQKVLKKAGFVPTGKVGEEGPLFARSITIHPEEHKDYKRIFKWIAYIGTAVLVAIILAVGSFIYVTRYKNTEKEPKTLLPIKSTENRKGELVFNISADDFIESYNSLYALKNKFAYLSALESWQKEPEETGIHSDYEMNVYRFTEDEKSWALPTISIYTPSDNIAVEEITVNFDWHSYTENFYEQYKSMCYYTLKTVFPKLSDKQITSLTNKANDSGFEHCFSSGEWYGKGRLPTEMFYKDNICVYSYFAIGSSQRLCIIPVTEETIAEFKEKGVIVYEIE